MEAAEEPLAAAQESVRSQRAALRAAMEQCQRVLRMLEAEAGGDESAAKKEEEEEKEEDPSSPESPSTSGHDHEADELCDLLKSKIESPDFLEKIESIYISVSGDVLDDSSSWDMVTTTDLWEDKCTDGNNDQDQDDYVLVNQEDIVDGIACFMAAYLLSLKQTKDLTPNQLQEALRKTLPVKQKKSKLQRAWDGSKVIYNVASWGATAIGIYQNPALVKAASLAIWSSYHAISKLL